MKANTKFEMVLFFHGLLVIKAEVKKKRIIVTQDRRSGALIVFFTKVVVHVFKLFTSKSKLCSVSIVDDDVHDLEK